ncbi:hypothetical protein CICLE_v10018265mg [Citrus x clementina]|uniref:Uncharacterized protein n=1 Tax=Citrus clementina TaxID=85681 RepID=V4TFF1_CITCL|nr:hypothetical protein CICLE_v10018265mg [Citrus x clementina]
MASSRPETIGITEQWLLKAVGILVCGFLGYLLYDTVMAAPSELLQRLLVMSPLILIITVHWLSSGSQDSLPIPGSEPGAFHPARGSPWGAAKQKISCFSSAQNISAYIDGGDISIDKCERLINYLKIL